MEMNTLTVENEYALYALSMVVVFLIWVIGYSIYEGYKKEFHWRWAIILLLALVSFFQFGYRTGTFNFILKKTGEFLAAPPWKSGEPVTEPGENTQQ